MLISLPSFHLISPIFASLLTVSWWAYWQLQWENLSHEQDAPEVPTTGSTRLLIQLEGIPALTRDGLMNHPFSVLKLFLPIVHYILCSLFCWRVSFKRSPPLSFPHGQIFLLKWISPISTETFCFSHFRKKRKIKKKILLTPLLIQALIPLLPFTAKFPSSLFLFTLSSIYSQLFDIHSN